jgi:hypothetical protein
VLPANIAVLVSGEQEAAMVPHGAHSPPQSVSNSSRFNIPSEQCSGYTMGMGVYSSLSVQPANKSKPSSGISIFFIVYFW